MTSTVNYERRGRVGVISLNRPDARNAINGDVASGIEASIDAIENSDDIWLGILRANTEGQTSPVFCAGADLKAIRGGTATGMQTRRGGFAGITFRDRRKPLIVAVDGLATAGGCEIVLACDIVVATTRSSFGLAEVKRSLIAGAGGLFRLPRAIGQAAAALAILTGEPLPAERAYQLGLVSSLVGPGEAFDEALRIAEQIVACAPLAVYASRQVILASYDRSERDLIELTKQFAAEVAASRDRQEGLTAFVERRMPIWTGS